MSKLTFAVLATALLTGCVASESALLHVSESSTNCTQLPHEKAVIRGYRLGLFDSEWTYECQDKYWHCFATDTLKEPHCRRVDANGESIKDTD